MCRCSFSVTAKTMFHKTKVDLQKWFYVIQREGISIRKLAVELQVAKKTADYMLARVKLEKQRNPNFLNKIKESL